MQRFPDDTQDSVEKLYADIILRHFPNYGVFWETFVGQRVDPATGALVPYPLIFPPKTTTRQRAYLTRQYELMRMQNYSIFVHLAGAHYQTTQLDESLRLADAQDRHFRHWECYDVGLLHLSTTISLAKVMVSGLAHLTGTPRLMHHLVHHTLWKELDRAIRRPRNDAVHYSRRLHRSNAEAGTFEVLKDRYFESRRVWSQDLRLVGDDSKWIPAGDKLRRDITDTETMLNDVWEQLLLTLSHHMRNAEIQLCYDGVHPPPPPEEIAPAVDTVTLLRRTASAVADGGSPDGANGDEDEDRGQETGSR